LKESEIDAAITLVNSNQLNNFKSAAGVIFERLAHKRISESGISSLRRNPNKRMNKTKKAIWESCKPFGVNETTTIGPLHFNPQFPLSFSDLIVKDISKIDREGYYEPDSGNFKSIDSLSIINYDVFVFQMTNSKDHPVIASGLKDVVDAVERLWPAEKEKFRYHLVFVFPKGEKASAKFYVQPILGADGKSLVVVPDKIKPFVVNQWIAEIEILDSVAQKFVRES